ncbi:MAG: AIR carboxylase family protein [Anaerolineae bacterium]|nr:AIR carboxylase family protein [Anaerolineae bacterium]
MPAQVVIIMGSKSDLEHANRIAGLLKEFGIAYTLRVASAHKSVRHLLALLESLNDVTDPVVLITVAGRSNALGGMVDANTPHPVITCPPISSAFGGADIYSSLRMPSGVAPTLVLEPEGAALAAAKILALSDAALRQRIVAYQAQMTQSIADADASLQ